MSLPKKRSMLVPLSKPRSQWNASFRRPLSHYVVSVFCRFVGKVYSLCFSWADRALARKHERQFVHDIQAHLQFLFSDEGAHVVTNQNVRFPPSFDGACVTVAIEPLLLRFVRGRGDFGVAATSQYAPDDWLDFQLLADAIPMWTTTASRTPYSLEGFAQILRPRLNQLRTAMSREKYEDALGNAIRNHNEAIDQYAARVREGGGEPHIY